MQGQAGQVQHAERRHQRALERHEGAAEFESVESWNARLIERKDNGVSESFTMNTELLELRELFA